MALLRATSWGASGQPLQNAPSVSGAGPRAVDGPAQGSRAVEGWQGPIPAMRQTEADPRRLEAWLGRLRPAGSQAQERLPPTPQLKSGVRPRPERGLKLNS